MVAINSGPDNNPPSGGIDLTRPPLPPRSALVSLRPIGVGTGMVESLWGYLVRLSAAHAISLRDLWRIVAPQAGIPTGQGPNVSLKGDRAASMSAALEKLTLRHDVRRTTLVAAERNSGVVLKTASTRAWCCTCLETDEVPYDRLLWNIGLGSGCSIHSHPLRRLCPACERTQPLIANGSRIMRCAWCREPLTKGHQHPVAELPLYDLWASREIAAFIAHFDSRRCDPKAVAANLNSTIKFCGGIKPTARCLRASPSTIRSWLRGTHAMALESVLRWAWLTSVSGVDLLSREVATSEVSLRDAAPKKQSLCRSKKKKLISQDYLSALEKFLKEWPLGVPTRTAIARILGGQIKTAAARSPQVIEAISAARRLRQMAARKAGIWRTVCEVYRAVSSLSKGGRPITSNKITAYLGSGLMRGSLPKRYLFSLQQQLNAGRMPPNPKTRLPQDVQAFWKHCDLI